MNLDDVTDSALPGSERRHGPTPNSPTAVSRRAPAAREPGASGAGDVLHAYMRSIRGIPVLSREQQYALAEVIHREADAFRAAMLAIPRTADAVLARWQRRKRTGHVSAALSKHYRDSARPRLSEEVDAALAPLEDLVARRRRAKSLRTRRRLESQIVSRLERAELALELLIEVHGELERSDARGLRERLREASRALVAMTEAKQRFVTHNLKLVVRYAKAYQRAEVPLLDLIQEGNVGLMRAVDKFDHTMGNTFSTYAVWWIQQAMVRAIQKHSRTVRVPSHLYDLQLKHRRAEQSLRASAGGEPDRDRIAAELGIDPADLDQLEASMRPIASTAKPVAGAEDLTLEDALADEEASDPVAAIDQLEIGAVLTRSLGRLSAREQCILTWRFGLAGETRQTLDEVGRRLGLSRERVRQIEQRALGRLRERDEVQSLAASLG